MSKELEKDRHDLRVDRSTVVPSSRGVDSYLHKPQRPTVGPYLGNLTALTSSEKEIIRELVGTLSPDVLKL